MQAYGITYKFNGRTYDTTVDAKDRDSARNKIGRKHGLKASEAKKQIKLTRVSIIGYF